MAEARDDNAQSPEDELQVCQQKINSLKTTSIVLGALSFILLIVIAGLTIIVMDKPKIEYATTEQLDAVSQSLALESAHLETLRAEIKLLSKHQQLGQTGHSKSNIAVQRDLVKIIQLMQNSMRDQSRMMPGSRSWYEHYNSQLEGIEAALKKQISASEFAPSATTLPSNANNDDFSDSPF